MTQDLATIGATPSPTASAREIIQHLAQILNRFRADQSHGSVDQPRRFLEAVPYTAQAACISVPYADADKKWEIIASDPKCMAMLDELRFYRYGAEYDSEIISSEDIIERIHSKSVPIRMLSLARTD
jgi:hypothetical protein